MPRQNGPDVAREIDLLPQLLRLDGETALAGRGHRHDRSRLVMAAKALAVLDVAAGPLLDDESFTADAQIVARDWFRPLTSVDVGPHPHPGWPYLGLPLEWRRGSPVLGEDNEYGT